jgi:hypothetical protein
LLLLDSHYVASPDRVALFADIRRSPRLIWRSVFRGRSAGVRKFGN